MLENITIYRDDDPSLEESACGDSVQLKVNEYFTARSGYWEELYRQNDVNAVIYQQRRAIALRYVDELSMPKESRILEIGCGAGLTTVELAQRGYFIEALDSVPAMVNLTRRHAVSAGVDDLVNVSVGDVHRLPFQDRSFDLIIALGVIPWLSNVKQAFWEMARVLSTGSYVILTADNRYRLTNLLDPYRMPALLGLKKGFLHILDNAGLRNLSSIPGAYMHSVKEMNHFLTSADLTILKQTTMGFGPFSFLKHPLFNNPAGVKIHYALQKWANWGFPMLRSAGAQYIVLARKD